MMHFELAYSYSRITSKTLGKIQLFGSNLTEQNDYYRISIDNLYLLVKLEMSILVGSRIISCFLGKFYANKWRDSIDSYY